MGEQHHKFLSPVAGQQVRLAQTLAGDPAKAAKDFVATVMAVVVVDLLEMVQVDNRQVEAGVVTVGQGDFLFQPFQEMAAVVQAGEIIADGNGFQTSMGVAQIFPLVPDPGLQIVDIAPPCK